jgi:hypothetical protein
VATGAVFAAQGQLPEARSALEHAVQFRGRVPGISPWATVEAMAMLTQVLLDIGDRSAAAALVDQMRLLLTSQPDPTAAMRARLERLERQAAGRPRPHRWRPAQWNARSEAYLSQARLFGRSGRSCSCRTRSDPCPGDYRKLGVSTRRVLHGHDATSLAARRTSDQLQLPCAADRFVA